MTQKLLDLFKEIMEERYKNCNLKIVNDEMYFDKCPSVTEAEILSYGLGARDAIIKTIQLIHNESIECPVLQ